MSTFLRTLPSRLRRHVVTAGLAVAAFSIAACSADRVVAPFPTSAAAHSRTASDIGAAGDGRQAMVPTRALLRNSPLGKSIVESVLVTKSGGKIELEEAGLSVIVPPGAIDGDTLTITVTALAGSAVAYEFEPHGTTFRRSLRFKQSTKGTTWEGGNARRLLGGGYFKDATQINRVSGDSWIDARVPVRSSPQWVTMELWHFSGYMISMD